LSRRQIQFVGGIAVDAVAGGVHSLTWTLKDALWSRRASPQRFAEEAAAARQFSAAG